MATDPEKQSKREKPVDSLSWKSLKDEMRGFAEEYLPSKNMALAFGACGVLIGCIVLVGYLMHRHVSNSGPGKLVSAHLVPLEHDGKVLLVGESVTHTGHNKGGTATSWETGRIDTIDLADGHRRARVVFDKPHGCLSAASAGLAWCDSGEDGALEVRDAATLSVHVSHAKLFAKAPAFNSTPDFDRRTGFAWFYTGQQAYWYVSPSALVSGIETESPASDKMARFAPRMGPVDSLTEPGGFYTFEGTPQSVFTFHDALHQDPQTGDIPLRPIAADTKIISPHFVVSEDQDPTVVMRFDADRAFLVAHDDSVDHKTANLLITAMTTEGRQHWSMTFPHGELVGAWLIDNRLILAIGGPVEQGAVVALDPADGRVLWRTGT